MFIGREKELAELNRLYEQNCFQMFVLYGRRRVGKTTLMKEFCKGKASIFYSAQQSNEKLNLDKFSELVFKYYGESVLEPFSSWEHAIMYIHARQLDKPLILVFDEFPYLAELNQALLSTLQHLIDHFLQNGKLFMILCGSYMGFMEKDVMGAKSPLFGRRTSQLHMKAFDYYDSIKFLEGFTDEEKLILYGALGGTALYLGQVRTDETVQENFRNLFLSTTGYLYEEPLLLLRQEVQEPGIYFALLEAIAKGASKSNEIAAKTGEEPAKCLKYMKTLRELGLIEKETPFGEKDSSRKTIYRVSDFMFRFWYRYVFGNKTLLETGAQEIIVQQKILPDLNNYMGAVFERVCRDYLLRKNSGGYLPILFTEIGRWWGANRSSKEHEEVEIDIVARDRRDYLICECKWRNQLTDVSVLEKLEEKADMVDSKRNKTWYVLFSKSGFTSALRQQAEDRGDILLICLKDILTA